MFKINVHTIIPIFRKESEKKTLAKNNQVKFRIDDHTKITLKRVLENKKITIQSIIETLLMEYIIKNIDSVINE